MSRPYLLLNLSGPYGVGKDTLLNSILESQGSKVHRVSTLTTRPSSPDADPSYRSVSSQELKNATSSGSWIVTNQLNGQVKYATDLAEIDAMANSGRVAVHSIYPSDEGAGNLRRAFGNRLYSVGVLASDGDRSSQIEILRGRLLSRGRDSADVIDSRLRHQAGAIDYVLENPVVSTPDGPMSVFDHILINEDITRSLEDVRKIWAQEIEAASGTC